uniref:Leucine-rich repeat protein SHOC-2 n=1 Tax=Ciona intestinalis TaxID=7719 RepID=F6WKP3_CIOIN|nr:leucine-rich repeat-containing protein 69 isoform X3 [Ciona intestinalis]|eukprot:XP_018667143.1 leucine-rich repeat-containing protein 69 isoform X3 [Ciona intestinalis]
MYINAQLEVLNLGNNDFEDIPVVLQHLKKLLKLHLFGNALKNLNSNVLGSMQQLTFLNLNNNLLTELPPEISRLEALQVLSVCNNQLQNFPSQICNLPKLHELRASHNELESLPLEIGFLQNLSKLYISQNKIKELPEGLGKLRKLHLLDIAGNELRIFPTEMHNIPLKELYCEANPLLEEVPVHSVQEEEILSLKELCARLVMKEVKDKSSNIRHRIRYFKGVRELLSQASRCSVCSDAFLNTWLECVRFVKAGKDLKINKCNNPVIPVRALLCSYKCFNSEGHSFYGVAFP